MSDYPHFTAIINALRIIIGVGAVFSITNLLLKAMIDKDNIKKYVVQIKNVAAFTVLSELLVTLINVFVSYYAE